MKGFVAAAVFVLANLLLSTSALAQTPPVPEAPPTGPANRYPPLVLPDVPRAASGSNRPDVPREDLVLKKGLLAPSDADRVALAAFLRTRNTGLIRLLPREVYDSATYHTPKKLNIRGGGAYYSFATLTHAYGYGSDIELQRNNLSVGFAGADYGMLTNLRDVSLEDISLKDPRVVGISKYEPPRLEREARAEFRRFRTPGGVTIDGLVYRSRLPVEEGATYLLRSIVYERSDVLVAFRVVRKDTDGSVIIAWKLLKRYHPPELVRDNSRKSVG